MEVTLSPAELEVAGLIIETLNLEDVTAAEIEPDERCSATGWDWTRLTRWSYR